MVSPNKNKIIRIHILALLLLFQSLVACQQHQRDSQLTAAASLAFQPLTNFQQIRHNEIPRHIEVHFVENDIDPTGLDEPPFPPVFGALANALYRATGKRYYKQPFSKELMEGQGG